MIHRYICSLYTYPDKYWNELKNYCPRKWPGRLLSYYLNAWPTFLYSQDSFMFCTWTLYVKEKDRQVKAYEGKYLFTQVAKWKFLSGRITSLLKTSYMKSPTSLIGITNYTVSSCCSCCVSYSQCKTLNKNAFQSELSWLEFMVFGQAPEWLISFQWQPQVSWSI